MSIRSSGGEYRTPGVYVTELPAFPPSIVGVATAVPLFIGYTEFAGEPVSGASLYGTPVAIASMADYLASFGGPALMPFAVAPLPDGSKATPDFEAWYAQGSDAPQLTGFTLSRVPAVPRFSLYWQMQLFYANGGGACQVVSAGSYWAGQSPVAAPDPAGWAPGAIAAEALCDGIAATGHAIGPTMTVIPEACQLDQADYAAVIQAMMAQAGNLQDRVAILDLPGCLDADTIDALEAGQNALWLATGPAIDSASYAAAYAPALAATVATPDAIDFTWLSASTPDGNTVLNTLLTVQASQLYGQAPAQLASVQAAIATAFPIVSAGNTSTQSGDGSAWSGSSAALETLLRGALPLYQQIEQLVLDRLNIQAPSGAMAGIWTSNDAIRGVWNAPANLGVTAVTAPLYKMNDAEQANFNMPLNGQAIDVLRDMVNRGTLVWGARTLDGNSNDYRYIQVRRTLIYVEQSIKNALNGFAFAPNDGRTWSTVTATISSFLTDLWSQGGLMGDKASDAFQVQCGLGSTMTGEDILNGQMRVAVTLQMIRPAEFIVLSFVQAMTTGD